jgi:hypothetical protein
MPELGNATARAKPQSRRSFHETMAALINAIAPGSAAGRTSDSVENGSKEPPASVETNQNFDYRPLGGKARDEKVYDIHDAIAEVTAVAAAKPAPAPQITNEWQPIAAAPRTTNEWQPIATGPLDREVQVGIAVEGGVLPIFFPCRRTEDGWINAIVKAPLLHNPSCWREWPEQ